MVELVQIGNVKLCNIINNVISNLTSYKLESPYSIVNLILPFKKSANHLVSLIGFVDISRFSHELQSPLYHIRNAQIANQCKGALPQLSHIVLHS